MLIITVITPRTLVSRSMPSRVRHAPKTGRFFVSKANHRLIISQEFSPHPNGAEDFLAKTNEIQFYYGSR